MYTVYVHTCPNWKKYVGMTSKENPADRWKSGHGYYHCTDFYNAILEFGWRNISHEIIETGLTKEKAESMERKMIEFYHSNDPRYGYNSHSGGISGGNVNSITKSRMSKAQSGSGNPMFGRHHSEHSKEAIGRTKRGKPLTEECKRKLGEVLGGVKNPAAKPVFQYDKDMNFIKEWPYIRAARNATGANNIWACCVGRLKTSGGYVWRYERVGLT